MRSKKIVLLGHFGVGKSSLIRRFVDNVFSTDYKVTIGVHILKKEITLPNNNTVSLIIWDLEGSDDITQTRMSYLLGTDGFIYVYDLTRPITYRCLEKDIDYIKNKFPKTSIKVVGNKSDLVNKEFLEQNTDVFGSFTDYYISAKTGSKVEHLFHNLAKELTN